MRHLQFCQYLHDFAPGMNRRLPRRPVHFANPATAFSLGKKNNQMQRGFAAHALDGKGVSSHQAAGTIAPPATIAAAFRDGDR